jgi:hypothetical protein
MNIVIELKNNPTKELAPMERFNLCQYIKSRMYKNLYILIDNPMSTQHANYLEKIGMAGDLNNHSNIYNMNHVDHGYKQTMLTAIKNSIENISVVSEQQLRKMSSVLISVDNDFTDFR